MCTLDGEIAIGEETVAHSTKEVRGKGSVRTEAVVRARNTAEKLRD